MQNKEPKVLYFSSSDDSTLIKIIVSAAIFHLVIAGIFVGLHYVNLKPEPELIPVFEMVQFEQPQLPTPPAPPKTQQPKQKPKPKPKVDKELPPEIKPEPEEKPE